MKGSINFSLKNLTRQKRRNAVLVVAIAFGFFVVTAIDGLTTGLVGNLENQITQLVGGNVICEGLEWIPPSTENGKAQIVNIVRDRNYVKDLVDELGIKYDYYSCFTMSGGQIIFNGKKSIVQVYGRDLDEKHLRDSMQLVSGTIDSSIPNGLIISDKIANSMNLQVGDDVIFTTSTVYGQGAVADMKIAAIMKSNSFVNTMQSYCDIEDLNRIVEMPEGSYSMFSLYLRDKNQQTKAAVALENRIRQDAEKDPELNVTSRVQAMKTNPTNIGMGIEKQVDSRKPENEWKGVMYAIETLYDEIPQIKTVMNIVHIVATTILIVILLIVMIGVANTYRMVLYERIREIGTMRALGMTGKDTKKVFTSEAVMLCIIGAVAGLILAIIAMGIIHLIPVSNEALSLFLEKGHFSFKVSVGTVILQYVLLIVLTSWAVRGSAKKAAQLSPAEALRTIK
ncbi:MAG: ABC transporter permease [Treponema sp.]|nr:ABC transporter permease [Treponema sp.]